MIDVMKSQHKSLENKKNKLIATLTKGTPFIEGSLSITLRTCASKGCACHRGKKHPSMGLTWKDPEQKTKSIYIPVEKQKQAKQWSSNYKKLKLTIRKLSDVYKQLLVLKEEENPKS